MQDIHGIDLSSMDDFIALARESIQFDDVTHGSQRNTGDGLNEDMVMQYARNNSQEIRLQVGTFVSKALMEFDS